MFNELKFIIIECIPKTLPTFVYSTEFLLLEMTIPYNTYIDS